jgi:hypothetical protein
VRFLPARFINLPVGPDQRASAIPISFEMLSWLKAEITCVFAYLIVSIVSIAQSRTLRLSPWFLPIALLTLFATIAFYLVRIRKSKR